MLQIHERGARAFRSGQIAGDFGKSLEIASRITDRREYDVRPKTLAPLSNAPSLVLEAASLPGCRELSLSFTTLDVLEGIEQGEVTTYDFGGLVAFSRRAPSFHPVTRPDTLSEMMA